VELTASDSRVRVLLQVSVQDGVTDLIAHLVRVTFTDRLAREQESLVLIGIFVVVQVIHFFLISGKKLLLFFQIYLEKMF
jgi:hypothetical protein